MSSVSDQDAGPRRSGASRSSRTAEPSADQVAAWLRRHPEFFEQQREMLSQIELRHPVSGNVVSLIERQVLVLRDINRALERRLSEFLRIGRENDALSLKMQGLAHALLGERDPLRLPTLLRQGLRRGFDVPFVLVRLWAEVSLPDVSTGPVSATLRQWADRLEQPYCGPSQGHDEILGWFPERGEGLASMAAMALRAGNDVNAYGLLVIGSPDERRFQAGMGTAVLEQLADMAGASISRALPERLPEAPGDTSPQAGPDDGGVSA